jgi:prepilin-type N-terminal cleavage/methylation domain-containing protein/prepilin-type processing-associated H-X9-DG protein
VAGPRRTPAAFTLIELLVVIGIIGVLIGILLPATARARREARKVACKAQLANISAAMQMYLNENAGWYPSAPYSPAFNPNKLPLVSEYLLRYVTKLPQADIPIVSQLFHCPADDDETQTFKEFGLSYSYYEELADRRLNQTLFFKIMRSSSRTPVLWDAKNFHGGTVPYNWLFADGHVGQFLEDNPDLLKDHPEKL